MNLQIKVADVDALYADVQRSGLVSHIPLEERWYRQDQAEAGKSAVRRGRSRRLFATILQRFGQAASTGS